MRIQITAGGIYGANGQEVPIGTELTVKDEPRDWAGRYTVLSEGKGGKTAVTNPADEARPKLPLEAKDAGSGWFAVTDADGKEWGKKLRKDDADAFNGLSDEDKVAFALSED